MATCLGERGVPGVETEGGVVIVAGGGAILLLEENQKKSVMKL